MKIPALFSRVLPIGRNRPTGARTRSRTLNRWQRRRLFVERFEERLVLASSVSMVASPVSGSDVYPGQTITYTITVTNDAVTDTTSGNGFIRVFDSPSPVGSVTLQNPSVVTQPGSGSAWSCSITGGILTCYAGDGIGGGTDTFNANQTVVFKVDAVVNLATKDGTTITDTAFFEKDLDGNGVDEEFTASNAVTHHVVIPAADLGVANTATTVADPDGAGPLAPIALPANAPAGAAIAGGYLRLDVPFGNWGQQDAINVMLTDSLPGNATFVGALATGGVFVPAVQPPAVPFTFTIQAVDASVPLGPNVSVTCTVNGSPGDQSITCRPQGNTGLGAPGPYADGVLPAGYSGTLTFFVRVASSVADGTLLENAANITSGLCPTAPGLPPAECLSTADANPGNNTTLPTQTLVVAEADLGITKVTSNATPVNGGAAFSYTLVVTNNGPSDARNIVVVDPLPPGILLANSNIAVVNNPSTAGFGLTCSGPANGQNGTITCTGNLPGPNPTTGAVSSSTITIVAQASADVASGVRTNTATVTSDTQEVSPNVAPNTASVQQNLQVNAPLSISKAGPASVVPGQIFTYQITVNNGGSSNAINATISDPLPPETTLLDLHGTGALDGTCSQNGGVPGTVTCAAVDLPAGQSTLDITVQLSPKTIATSLSNTATITNAGTGTIAVGTATTVAVIHHPDVFDPNDTLATATVLGSLPEITLRDLSIDLVSPGVSDQDFFQYTAHDTGKLLINTQFTNVNGNTNLEVLDGRGNVIASSLNADPNAEENIVIPVVSQQRYFIHVFGVSGASCFYTLELENFAAPVPQEVQLDRTDDSGSNQLDNVTFRTAQLHYYVFADLSDFAQEGIPILSAAQAAAGQSPGAAVRVFDNGVPVGYANPVAGTDNTIFDVRFDSDLAHNAVGTASAAGPAGYQGFSNFIKAAVTIFDGQKNGAGQPTPAVSRTQQGPLLAVIADNTAPVAPTGLDLLPSSDGGQSNSDNDTLVNALAITGIGEVNTQVVVRANGLIVGQGQVGTDASDGVLGNGLGVWEITTEPLVPSATPYLITAQLEDLAGNIGPVSSALHVLIDPEGPQVTDVFITGHGPSDTDPYNLFAQKPANAAAGPTPAVNSLTIRLQDQPAGDSTFFAALRALNATAAAAAGNFLLVGDHSGVIPVTAVTVTNDPIVNGQPLTASIRLDFASPLPDDRFTLTIQDSVIDQAGNALDGESNASQPVGSPSFPSGNGLPGGDFVARFTVDSRVEIANYSAGSVFVDANGNLQFDPQGSANDATNRDLTFQIGTISDAIFAGKFEPAAPGSNDNDGFDKLGAYGYDNGAKQYRFLLDFNHDGVFDLRVVSAFQVNGTPVAGNFAPNHNGDEIGLFDGEFWYLDNVGDNQLHVKIPTNMKGLAFVGDFNGDGNDDLATYDTAANKVYFDTNRDGQFDDTLTVSGPVNGFTERVVAGDFNLDGVDDIGLWVPNRQGTTGPNIAEWYVLVSDHPNQALPHDVFDPYAPAPLGNDLFAQFGDQFSLPLVGNFDPPVSIGPPQADVGTNLLSVLDVNADGEITPLDALLVINQLNGTNASASANPHAAFMDVNSDESVSPLDALLVINYLNDLSNSQGASGGEGESGGVSDGLLAMLAADTAATKHKWA